MSNKVLHSMTGKKNRFSQKYACWGKNIGFQEFSNFSKSFGLTLLAPLAFRKLMIRTSCSSYLEMISKTP